MLSGVIWKGTAGRLKIQPEQGLEVVVTGRITTFPGQSKYQMVIETMEPCARTVAKSEGSEAISGTSQFRDRRVSPM